MAEAVSAPTAAAAGGGESSTSSSAADATTAAVEPQSAPASVSTPLPPPSAPTGSSSAVVVVVPTASAASAVRADNEGEESPEQDPSLRRDVGVGGVERKDNHATTSTIDPAAAAESAVLSDSDTGAREANGTTTPAVAVAVRRPSSAPVVSSSKKTRPPYKFDPSKVTLRFLFANRDGLTVTIECEPSDTVADVKKSLLSVWPEGAFRPPATCVGTIRRFGIVRPP